MADEAPIHTASAAAPISSVRFVNTSDNKAGLGLLAGLAGSWHGKGFNLIARPAHHYKTDLYLQLNQTYEHLQFEPIGSPIPNRGFGQEDINLYGLTYLQKIKDAGHDGALHIEPGIWVTQPSTLFPAEADPVGGGQIVARMASIPHGNALLAQGIAQTLKGPPVLQSPNAIYNGSSFPSFNTTPFPVPPFPPPAGGAAPPVVALNAATSSEKATAPNIPAPPFPMYDLTNAPGAVLPAPFNLNTVTPYDTHPPEPPLPANIQGVAMQDVVNDPISLLQQVIDQQVKEGCTFETTVLNVATRTAINFLTVPNLPASPVVSVNVPQFDGGTENIKFLIGNGAGTAQAVENAQTALVYSTFWIEKVTPRDGNAFMQLQYAQMVVLDYPIFHLLNPAPTVPPAPPAVSVYVNLGWPHVSVATLRKVFG